MKDSNHMFDWGKLAFASKKPVRELQAIFIAAPRELSIARFKQIVKTYLPKGNIVLGISKEPYVTGFEDQPQFRMLSEDVVVPLISQINKANTKHKLYVLHYFQRELPYILEKIDFQRIVLVNGSWQHVFHVSPSYYLIASKQTPYELISPFMSESEAKEYEARIAAGIYKRFDRTLPLNKPSYTAQQMLDIANAAATLSYDYSFQTGLCLGQRLQKQGSERYKFLAYEFNSVVPFQTYALLYGSSREKYFSPPQDLNHYDTNHAEVNLLLTAAKNKLDLKGTTLFINLMPCSTCARMLSQTDIEEIVYQHDHSDGYALKLFEETGKKIRRIV
jgi:deoxycytidylate deaminase